MSIRLGGITEDVNDPTRLLQVGDIMMSGRSVVRTGFLQCDGAAVSRAVYANLFAAIGINFGPGDGVTTFNLPDFRSRSPMGDGTGSGLSPRVIGEIFGEELHVLSVAELATHTHLQNAHNHTQDAHTHTQDSHNHTLTDPGHNHTNTAHTHVQDSHNHTQDAHLHALQTRDISYTSGAVTDRAVTGGLTNNTNNTTATNQATTATNQNTTIIIQSSTTGVASTATTATNQNTTATNQATTATNQNEGSNTGHNTVHPILVVLFQIKF